MEDKKEKEFTIRDRRSTTSENTAEPAGMVFQESNIGRQQPSDAQGAETDKESTQNPEFDFSSFILSLATTVQVSLGTIPNPQTNLQSQNLPAAKQMIDIINMLKEKTKGNLSNEEQALIESILYNLRMHYIRVMEGK